jgi:hypothetical protein
MSEKREKQKKDYKSVLIRKKLVVPLVDIKIIQTFYIFIIEIQALKLIMYQEC